MTHTRRNDDTWAAIRGDYLEGCSQPALAERYGVGRSTIRDRARREGWRRSDQPAPAVPPLDRDEDAQDLPMRPAVAVVADAYRRADLALRRGHTAEAQRCLAVARGFERLLLRDDWLREALNDYWDGESEAYDLRRFPPWPEGVENLEEARRELAVEHEALNAILDAQPFDPLALGARLERSIRLHACVDLARAFGMDESASDPTNPPDPPSPPCAEEAGGSPPPCPTVGADGADILPSPAGEVLSRAQPETGGVKVDDRPEPAVQPPLETKGSAYPIRPIRPALSAGRIPGQRVLPPAPPRPQARPDEVRRN